MRYEDQIAEFQRKMQRLRGTLNRRTFLGMGAALTGALSGAFAPRRAAAAAAAVPGPQVTPRAGTRNTWNVVVGGELMVARPFAMYDEPEFMSIIKLLRESDLTYCHLEQNFGNFNELQWASQGNWSGTFMIAESAIAKDLKWAGVDMVSLASNHSMDWSAPGVLSTIAACRAAGIAYAGTGRDLEEARSPAFVESKQGRAALISVSSGNRSFEWAGLAKGSIPGRPGMNPLRLEKEYIVDKGSAEQLRTIGRKLGVLAENNNNPKFNITPGVQSGHTNFTFAEGTNFDVNTFCDPADLKANERAIHHAKTMADFVIVAHHDNTADRSRGDVPDKFVREFARAAIDAGADLYVGHGWHRANAIEIYKGKPLIYGVGNFWAQNEFIEPVPADGYEANGYDMDDLISLHPGVANIHPGTGGGDGTWWTGAVYQLKFEDGKVREIRLHPIEMGWDITGAQPVRVRTVGSGATATGVKNPLTDGRPLMATGKQAQKILERLQRVYATSGTKVEIENGIGVVRISG